MLFSYHEYNRRRGECKGTQLNRHSVAFLGWSPNFLVPIITRVQQLFANLAEDLEEKGPIRPEWRDISKATAKKLAEVADHTLALTLAVSRKILLLHNSVAGGQWDFSVAAPVFRIKDLTVGLVAFGKIVRRVAEKQRILPKRRATYLTGKPSSE